MRDGLSVSLTVLAESTSGNVLAYQWYKLGDGDVKTPVSDGGGITGSKKNILKFTGAKASFSGRYVAVVYEPVGSPFPEVESPEFTLQVNVRPKIASNGQPTSMTVEQGGAVSFNVGLTPDSTTDGLTFQWQKNNVDITDNPSATTANFIIPPAAVGPPVEPGAVWQDNGKYRVKIVSSLTATTIFSKTVTLAVNSAPVILKQPAADTANKLYIATKGSGKLSVIAGGNPKLNYKWEKMGDASFGPATASSLTVKDDVKSGAGFYRVGVTNFKSPLVGVPQVAEPTYSQYAEVIILNKPTEVGTIAVTSNKSPEQPNEKGEFTADFGDSEDLTPEPDTEVTLTLTPNEENTGDLEFQWQKDGKNIYNETEELGTEGVTGAQTRALKFAPLNWIHRGVYRCVVKNKVGTYTSKTYTLKVNSRPVLVTPPPAEVVGIANKSISISLVAGGNAPLKYQWWKEGDTEDSMVPKATSSRLTLSRLGDTSEGVYYCIITNLVGPVNEGGKLKSPSVTVRVDTPVTISEHPLAEGIETGATLTLSVRTGQGDGPIKYQWQRNNVNLVNGPNITGAETTVTGPAGLRDAVSLTITNIQLTDAGTYRCIVSNVEDAVKVTSKTAKITVLTPPSIVTPAGQPADQEVFEDTDVTFKVIAAGSPRLTYQWEKSATEGGTYTPIAKATTATLKLNDVQAALVDGDQGYYRCVVQNDTSVTATSNAAKLTVNLIPNPTITSFTPRKARTTDKLRITGTNLSFVSEVRFRSLTGPKGTVVKEEGGTLLVTVPGGLPAAEEVAIFAISKNGFAQTSIPGSGFTLSSTQINDRNNPTIVVGTTFTAQQGATTVPLLSTFELPTNGFAEAVYTWVFPKAGTYGIVVNSNFQVWFSYDYNGDFDRDYSIAERVYSTELVVEDDNTPVTFAVFGVAGTGFFGLQDFGSYALQVSYIGPNAPSPTGATQTASLDSWETEGKTGEFKTIQMAEGDEEATFTGSSSAGAQPTVLWTDATEIEAGPDSIVSTEWTMSIDQAGAGTQGHFAWQVSGANGSPLGQLQFSVADGAIYLVEANGTRTKTEPYLVPGSPCRFEITTDLGNGTWQAFMDGAALGEPLPLPVNSGFGDASVIWYPASSETAQPTMTFDDVSITVD